MKNRDKNPLLKIPDGKGKACVLLLSGGLDSTTLLAGLRARGWEVNALTLRYGQKHDLETEMARRNGRAFGCKRHLLLNLPLASVARCALTTPEVAVPPGGGSGDAGIPATYVPARNLVFLSLAVSWAESLEIDDIFIAVSSVDYSGYPDCREPFIHAFEAAALLGTKVGVEKNRLRVHTPLIMLSKKETIELGLAAGVDYAATLTCYRPDAKGRPCGVCDSCLLRMKGFKEAGLADPALKGDDEAFHGR